VPSNEPQLLHNDSRHRLQSQATVQ